MKEKKLRTEIVLTDADADIIAEIEASGLQRATFFKMAAREYARLKNEEQFDARVERLLHKVLAERGVNSPQVSEVKPKKKLGFGAKKG